MGAINKDIPKDILDPESTVSDWIIGVLEPKTTLRFITWLAES